MKSAGLIHFLHIPKAAGSSVMTLLARQYGGGRIYTTDWGPGTRFSPVSAVRLYVGRRKEPGDVWFPEPLADAAARFWQLPDEQRAAVRVIHGHHNEFGLHEYLPQPLSYLAVLRDPVDRVLSHYYWTAYPRPDDVSLYEHVAACIEPNLQTRMLSGPHGQGALPPPDEMLDRARRNLHACAVVGLAERFDETALLLQRAFGWRRRPFYSRVNVNRQRPRRSDVPQEILDQIRADNHLDAALYQYAAELFEGQVRRYGPTLEGDLRTFRVLNAWWQRGYTLRRWPGQTAITLCQRAYDALAGWGGLRRLVPSQSRPRVAPAVEDGLLRFDLVMGQRVVGAYDPQKREWLIRRPYHLFVDASALPRLPMGVETHDRRDA